MLRRSYLTAHQKFVLRNGYLVKKNRNEKYSAMARKEDLTRIRTAPSKLELQRAASFVKNCSMRPFQAVILKPLVLRNEIPVAFSRRLVKYARFMTKNRKKYFEETAGLFLPRTDRELMR